MYQCTNKEKKNLARLLYILYKRCLCGARQGEICSGSSYISRTENAHGLHTDSRNSETDVVYAFAYTSLRTNNVFEKHKLVRE